VGADGDGHRGVVTSHLLDGSRVGHIAESEAAVGLGHDETEEAELPHLLEEVGRHFPGHIPGAKVLGVVPEEIIDRFDDRNQDLTLVVAQGGEGEENLLLDFAGAERTHEADARVVHGGLLGSFQLC
jgi:hypothetical protein